MMSVSRSQWKYFSVAAGVFAFCGLVLTTQPSFAAASGRAGVGASGSIGGNPSANVNSRATINSNGPNAIDRDTGRDRAEDRMSQQGLSHNKAGIADTDNDTTSPDKAKKAKSKSAKAKKAEKAAARPD